MITGFNISEVTGKVESTDLLQKQRFPRLNINLEDVKASGTKMMVKFTFQAEYFDSEAKEAKSIGLIKVSGNVDVEESKANIESISKKWQETKTLPTELAEELINGLNFRCGASGTLLAYSLGLIPPLVISQTRIEQKK